MTTGRKNRCSKCGELGHNRSTCPKLRGKLGASGKSPKKPMKQASAKAKPSSRIATCVALRQAEQQLEAEMAALGETLSQVRAVRLALEARGKA